MIEIDMCVFFCVVALLLGAAISGTISMYRGIKESKRAFDDGRSAGRLNVLEHTKPIEKPNWPAIACKDCDAYKLWISEQARQIEQKITLKVNLNDKTQMKQLAKQLAERSKRTIKGYGWDILTY
jgi:hypothetical protein